MDEAIAMMADHQHAEKQDFECEHDEEYDVECRGDDIRNSNTVEDLYNIVKERIEEW